jgi:hypothetical protein
MQTHARAKLGPAGRFALTEAIGKGMTHEELDLDPVPAFSWLRWRPQSCWGAAPALAAPTL